ncbi:hypothetical protein Trydic_g16010 [Trypoxylus dichotomus]
MHIVSRLNWKTHKKTKKDWYVASWYICLLRVLPFHHDIWYPHLGSLDGRITDFRLSEKATTGLAPAAEKTTTQTNTQDKNIDPQVVGLRTDTKSKDLESEQTLSDSQEAARKAEKSRKRRLRRKKDPNNPPLWRTQEIIELSRNKDKLLKRYKITNSKSDLQEYRKARNLATARIRREKKKLEDPNLVGNSKKVEIENTSQSKVDGNYKEEVIKSRNKEDPPRHESSNIIGDNKGPCLNKMSANIHQPFQHSFNIERLLWVKSKLESTYEDWKRVIFSNESKLDVCVGDSRK